MDDESKGSVRNQEGLKETDTAGNKKDAMAIGRMQWQ